MKEPSKRRVAGYSMGLETMCWMIKKGETEAPKFKWILEYYRLSEDLAWEIYVAWQEHKIHPKAKEIMQGIFGV